MNEIEWYQNKYKLKATTRQMYFISSSVAFLKFWNWEVLRAKAARTFHVIII